MKVGSLFTGIGGFDLAAEHVGFVVAYQAEIETFCNKVLPKRFPGVRNLGDVTKIDGRELPYTEIICGGSPCQGFSLAGRREGLADSRSGLFGEFIRIVEEARPEFVVFENVPGLLSCNGGRDFAAVLGAFRNAGALDIAWRVLDARWFGVPQRRRRLFIVADFRAHRAAAVLFEPEGGAGHPPAGGAAEQEVAGTLVGGTAGTGSHNKPNGSDRRTLVVAAPLTSGSSAASGVNVAGRRREDDVNLVLAPGRCETCDGLGVVETGVVEQGRYETVRCRECNGTGVNQPTEQIPPEVTTAGQEVAGTLGGGTGNRGWCDDFDRSGAFVLGRPDGGKVGEDVAHALRASHRGVDEPTGTTYILATETGKGWYSEGLPRLRSTGGGNGHVANIVAQCHGNNVGPMGTLRAGKGDVQSGVPFTTVPAEAFPDPAYTLAAGQGGSKHGSGRDGQDTFIVARTLTAAGSPRFSGDTEDFLVAHALTSEGHDASEDGTGRGTPLVVQPEAVAVDARNGTEDDVAISIQTNPTSLNAQPLTRQALSVRRLTPTECERLQGFPDGHTCVCEGRGVYGACKCKDSPRYRALGNAVAVPVVQWIFARLKAVVEEGNA